ncbi:apolipoprotein N-acyltransferase [Roseiarcus fermentans]|uniref:apolipoprotein N-acyltransferase n=1 Tax=Roseiarcus fermentans TaxID=1473586 RepID=UPI0014748ED0|nr:apolipoprotein N-acyltransferase [Roseiarcus fermentans]
MVLSLGWRRRGIAFLSGAIGALALPPFGLILAMAVPMTVAVWLIDGSQAVGMGRLARLKSAFGAGWWLGFGYFLLGLWWVGAACLVDGDRFLWALPLGVLALPAGLALFPALGFVIACLLWSSGPRRVFALAFGLGASEWARGLLFTGFPWNDIGMALGANLMLAQTASSIGLHGLTFVAIALFATPATLWHPGQGLSPNPTIAALLVLTAMAGMGSLRLSAPSSDPVPGVRLRLIQPNISQGASFAPENKDAIVRRYLELSDRDGGLDRQGDRFTHLIWPESAFPFILSRDPRALGDIASLLGRGAVLITGAATADMTPEREAIYHNSIEMVGRDGLLPERYDKHHLVPFGEYLPFQSFLKAIGATQFVQAPGGFAAGAGQRALAAPGLPPATPLICYEAIFPVEVGDAISGAKRAGWLLNVTDDAWFGTTPGPYQHYAQARLRAIELGLPLVRVANSGISAVVDGMGREIAAAPLGVETVLDAHLPEALAPTWQSRFGSATAATIGVVFLFLAAVRWKPLG